MRVAELIELLRLAEPEAEVFGEFEGDHFPIDADDVRVAPITLLSTGHKYTDGSRLPPMWILDSHPWVSGEKTVFGTDLDGTEQAIRKCQGVLLWAGQSDDEWPERLNARVSGDSA